MLGIFRDRTIENAVKEVLAERVRNAQQEFEESVVELDNILEDEVTEAEARNRAAKEAKARELADKVLGR